MYNSFAFIDSPRVELVLIGSRQRYALVAPLISSFTHIILPFQVPTEFVAC
jgi:hypothetical protein